MTPSKYYICEKYIECSRKFIKTLGWEALCIVTIWHISFHVVHFFQTENNLTDEEAGIGLRMFNSDVPIIDQRCPWTPEPKCTDKQVPRSLVYQ